MANVQLDNGFTRIANELLEVVMNQKLNGTQFKIIMAVWRYTYGYSRKQHEMSLGFISEATGVHKQTVRNELEKLIERKIIKVIKESSFSSSRVISFNKNYIEWEGLQSAKRLTVSKKANTAVSELTDTTVSELTDQERKPKENIKEIQSQVIFDHYISKNIIQHKQFDSDMKKAVKKAITKFGIDEVRTAIDNYAVVIKSDAYWFTQKYNIINMMRDKDIRQFGSEADPLSNFLVKEKNQTKQSINWEDI
ncbi:replication protein [Virgibacillus litoralis]|uniref:Phage replication O-like protein O n=1 Tax=Virgibacillus litoralis TaxID=578221 RepID=A0ABS4HH49_9BACI|nr:replication protein [Virgibacillus litoralis]MBP1950044.1 phage replication O-like protein O [Virgibacillus litoralis]